MSTANPDDRYSPGWKQSFHVGSYEVDPAGSARLATIFNYLQETAGSHAEHLDLGYHALRSSAGLGFVLSRIHLSVARLPRWDESVTIVTWPKRAEKLLALRDFVVLPSSLDGVPPNGLSRPDLETQVRQKESIIRASTAWLLIDVERMRPVRPERNLSHIPTSPDLDSIAEVPKRLVAPDRDAVSEQSRIARYSDIDQNDHVNNARYVEWITDFLAASAIPTADHNIPTPREVTINFTGQVKLGDSVVIRGVEGDGGTVWITRDEETAVVAELFW